MLKSKIWISRMTENSNKLIQTNQFDECKGTK